MKLAICGSMSFASIIIPLANDLKELGHSVILPKGIEKYLVSGYAEDANDKIEGDFIRHYHEQILFCDAIFVLNFEKNGVKGYIGPNTFLEMGFAYILKKPIFLFNPIPDSIFSDEIKAMKPIEINGDLALLKSDTKESVAVLSDIKNIPQSEISKHIYIINRAYELLTKSLRITENDLATLSQRKKALQDKCSHANNPSVVEPIGGFYCVTCEFESY